MNLEVDPPRRLVQTMVALWGDDVRARGPPGSRGRSNRSAIMPLAVTHDQLPEDANEQLTAAGHDPVRPEDVARDRSVAHHSGIADVRLTR